MLVWATFASQKTKLGFPVDEPDYSSPDDISVLGVRSVKNKIRRDSDTSIVFSEADLSDS
jgi:hypothetical protein